MSDEELRGSPPSPAYLLRAVGAVLYGAAWQSRLAYFLEVDRRTMRRWLAGHEVPPNVLVELARLARVRLANRHRRPLVAEREATLRLLLTYLPKGAARRAQEVARADAFDPNRSPA